MSDSRISPWVDVEFKAARIASFLNTQEYPLREGDLVVVRVERGMDVGFVRRIHNAHAAPENNLSEVLRKATRRDLERQVKQREREDQMADRCRAKVCRHKLPMKVVDAETQYDAKKLTFYFTANGRVDFRELVKDLASEFRTRIELRQIGAREESRRQGGCGVCGIEKCCISCIQKFQPITTDVAKDQNLPINPARLTGACGKLKCCLLFERDMYVQAVKDFPALNTRVTTSRGVGKIIRFDVYQGQVVLQYEDTTEQTLTLDEVHTLLDSRN